MSTKTPDEKPKRKIAKQVIAPKRRYFLPHLGRTVVASDAREAVKVTPSEEGDGNR